MGGVPVTSMTSEREPPPLAGSPSRMPASSSRSTGSGAAWVSAGHRAPRRVAREIVVALPGACSQLHGAAPRKVERFLDALGQGNDQPVARALEQVAPRSLDSTTTTRWPVPIEDGASKSGQTIVDTTHDRSNLSRLAHQDRAVTGQPDRLSAGGGAGRQGDGRHSDVSGSLVTWASIVRSAVVSSRSPLARCDHEVTTMAKLEERRRPGVPGPRHPCTCHQAPIRWR